MSQELKNRMREFSIRVIQFVRTMKKSLVEDVLLKQLLRSATSVGANYRSALRARSKADFISKITVAEEEADESCYWLELLSGSGIGDNLSLIYLIKEAKELTAILTASGRTAKLKIKKL